MTEHLPNGLLIKQLHDCLEKQANNTLRQKELTMMQVAVLLALQESERKQLSMKELERHFHVAQSTAAGIVSRLEQKGLAEAFSDAADKRIKIVHMTEAGEACCAAAAAAMKEAERLLLRGFTAEERQQFNRLLAKAVNNVK